MAAEMRLVSGRVNKRLGIHSTTSRRRSPPVGERPPRASRERRRGVGASKRGDRMSDRSLWLEEWCPTCRVAPGARCRAVDKS